MSNPAKIIDDRYSRPPLWTDEQIVAKWRTFDTEYAALVAMTTIRDDYQKEIDRLEARLEEK